MHSPALAFGWQLWRRHRFGLALVFYWVFALAVGFQVVRELRADWLISEVLLGAGAMFPGFAVYIYLLIVFTLGAGIDVAARTSGFPARLFQLPVPTAALVLWPMLYGSATIGLVWLLLVLLVIWPVRLAAPPTLVLPILGAAAGLAWVQALVWSPFPFRWARVISLSLTLVVFILTPALHDEFGLGTNALAAVFVCYLGAAYALALAGVSRARRGDELQLVRLGRLLAWLGSWAPRRRRSFTVPIQAQLWFEWRRYGMNLPRYVACVALPLLFCFPWFADFERMAAPTGLLPTISGVSLEASIVLKFVGTFLLVLGPLLASSGGPGFACSMPWRPQLGPFFATRPLPTATLAFLEFRTAARSTLASWAVILVFLALWLLPQKRYEAFLELRTAWLQNHTPAECAALALLTLGLFVLWTWSQLVKGLFFTFTGRRWIHGSVLTGLILIFALCGVLAMPRSRAILWALLPWLAAVALLLKLLAAGAAARAVVRQGLLGTRDLASLLGIWLMSMLALVALFAWLAPTDLVPVWLLICGVVLAVPLARLIAAPVALAWNRHR